MARTRAVGSRARHFGKLVTEKLCSTRIASLPAGFFTRSIQIAAAALGNFDNGMAVFSRDLHHQIGSGCGIRYNSARSDFALDP